MNIIKNLWAVQKYLWVNIDLIIGIHRSTEIIHKPQTLGNRVVHMLMSYLLLLMPQLPNHAIDIYNAPPKTYSPSQIEQHKNHTSNITPQDWN
jgi:hypothetical protein